MYDIIVVGARCAGSPAAMLLAKKGYKVLLLDRSSFPSDKPLSTHYLLPNAIAALKRFGLLEKLQQSNCPPLKETLVDWGSGRFCSQHPPVEGLSEGYCPRRYILDQILLEGALEAGVEFREHSTLTDLVFENGKVVGIKYQHKNQSAIFEERASIVIGADGLFSQVAQKVQAKKYNEVPTQSAVCFSYWENVEIEAPISIYLRPDRILAMGRTNDQLTVIQDYLPVEQFKEFKKDLGANYLKDFQRYTPELYERISKGKRVEKWLATDNQPNFFRTPLGPGWALVGDASLHHDSNNPSGISYAFINTEKMVATIDKVLSENQTYESALQEYEAWRLQRWGAHYGFLTQNAEPRVPDEKMRQLLGIMSQDPQVAYEFLGFFNGNEGSDYFLTEENLRKIFLKYAGQKNPPAQQEEVEAPSLTPLEARI